MTEGKRFAQATHRPPCVQAALAIIERRDRYLICRRRAGGSLGGYWEFPGGKRKRRESWEACLRRELREELGVEIARIRSFGCIRHRYPQGAILFRLYRCALARGRPRPLTAQALRWVAPRNLRRYLFPPANRRLIARLSGERARQPLRARVRGDFQGPPQAPIP